MSLLDALRRVTEAEPLPAGGAGVHVHLLRFPALRAEGEGLSELLSPDERRRASAFRFRDDADRFRAGRGLLRWLLGCYLGEPAERLRFEYSPHGRPSLPGQELRFSVAHTRRYLALAFARGGDVGVDVEGADHVTDPLEISRRFFAPAEHVKLATLPCAVRERAFLRCWTQKEAYVKAHGLGLSMPLDAFEVAVLPEERCGLLAVAPSGEAELSRWELFETDDLADAHVALAVEGAHLRVRAWRWEGPGEPRSLPMRGPIPD
jgi:4'-phosphopantetheinyl transferase